MLTRIVKMHFELKKVPDFLEILAFRMQRFAD